MHVSSSYEMHVSSHAAPGMHLTRTWHADVSPTPVFGECMKTCDLGAMFANHQPKRRRYDKRTSSANWGDDGYPPPPPLIIMWHILYIFLGPWLKLQGSRGQREREREKFLDNH
jgi:hypothetical protein